ncbi:HGGxSTG domain-containing protein [Salinisphaera shabanensis]|uniref:HGGxSTG domain-containing protein n=1 Tax=Salinisphaera shabanensis TaxID=180542 RepID=UPI003B84B252
MSQIKHAVRTRPYYLARQTALDARIERTRTLTKANRVACGAKRRSDGEPCEAPSVPGKRRCKWHGGCSTGPRTPEGKARVAENLNHRR